MAGAYVVREGRQDRDAAAQGGTESAVTEGFAGWSHRHDVLAPDPHGGRRARFVATALPEALATTGAKRSKFFPTVPTVAEGGLPGYESVGWFGLLAPAHTPKDIVEKLNQAVVAIMATPDFRRPVRPSPALSLVSQTPEEFGRHDQCRCGEMERAEKSISRSGAVKKLNGRWSG